MEVITYKCPNCGGDLTFDPASGKYKCEYCLSSFTQEEAEKANPKAAEALNGEDDAAGAQEASDAQKESSTEETKGETEQSALHRPPGRTPRSYGSLSADLPGFSLRNTLQSRHRRPLRYR